MADLLPLLAEPGIGSTYDLMHHPTLLDAHLRPWLAARPVAEVVERLQEVRAENAVAAAAAKARGPVAGSPQLSTRRSVH